jgi:phosphoglycolate phosphatase-like HAD superfamily hydrolase
MPKNEAARALGCALKMVGSLPKEPSGRPLEPVVDVVWDSLPKNKLALCRKVKEYLGYPGNPPSSLLASLFDELYHGGELYREMYGAEPKYHAGLGLIEHDRILIRQSDLATLSTKAQGRLAISTGRPKLAAEYSLGGLVSYFRKDASVFIGDGDIHPTPEADSFRKPSGKSLLWAREKLRSNQLVYVGDSAEDFQMVENARKSTDGLAFAGVYGSSYSPSEQLRYFKRQGSELILPSVRALVRVMGEVSAG